MDRTVESYSWATPLDAFAEAKVLYHKIILAPSKKLLTTVRPNTSNVTFSVSCVWVEE